MLRWLWSIVIAGFAGLGCGAGPLTPPTEGGRPWRKFESGHFVLQSDLDERDAQSFVRELERVYEVFQKLAFPYELSIHTVTHVAVFADLRNLEPLGRKAFAGQFSYGSERFDEPPILLLPGMDLARNWDLFQHELCHRFVAFYYPAASTWLHEGLCEYHSTLELAPDAVTFGRYLDDRTFTANLWGVSVVNGRVYVAIPASAVPPLLHLRAADAKTYYALDAENPDSDAALKQRLMYYAGAWASIHALQSVPDGRSRWSRYLDALLAGTLKEPDAFASSYGDLPESVIEEAFRQLLSQHQTELVRVPFVPSEVPDAWVSPMTAAEVHLLWARGRNWGDPESALLAQQDLERAVRLTPNDPEVHRARGLQRLAAGEKALARADLRRAAELAPDNPRFLHSLALLEQASLPPAEGPDSRGHSPGARHSEHERLTGRLFRVAKTASQLDFVARTLLARGNGGGARRLAEKALRADPTCALCVETLAMVAEYRKEWETAVTLQTLAINLTPHGFGTKDMLARLERYSAELARKRSPAP